MTATSLPALRPLGIGELLDQAIRLYRRNFLRYLGIIAVVQIPVGLLQFLIALLALRFGSALGSGRAAALGAAVTPAVLGSYLVGFVSFILVQGVGTAAMTRAVADNYLGTRTGFADAYRRIGRAWLPLLGTLFVAGLLAFVLGLWFLVPCIGWGTGLGILAFYSAVLVPLVAPIVVLEGKSG